MLDFTPGTFVLPDNPPCIVEGWAYRQTGLAYYCMQYPQELVTANFLIADYPHMDRYRPIHAATGVHLFSSWWFYTQLQTETFLSRIAPLFNWTCDITCVPQ